MKKLLAFLVVATMLATLAVCAVSVSAASTNLALNKKYTGAEPSTHPNNVNYNAKLTDGVAAKELAYDAGIWFAFYNNEAATGEGNNNAPDGVGTVIIDLEAVSDLTTVKINTYLGNIGDGILPPKSMKVEASADGETYTQIGETQSFTAEEGAKEVKWIEYKASTPVSGRYVKVTIELASSFAFIDEIEVYGADAAGDDGDSEDEGSKNESSTSTPSTSEGTSSGSDKPTTGDAGMLAFAVLAVLAVAGSVAAVRVRH